MTRFISDSELFASFIRGDNLAIEKVYSLHFRPLCFFAERITGTKEDAQDLVADSFIKMLNKREEFQNLSNVRSFLYLVTRNACLNFIKARATHDKAHRQIRFLSEDGKENTGNFNEEMLRVQVLREIHAEMENLPPRCKEIFKLIFIEGLSSEEISVRLKINAQTVRTQKARALQLIKSGLLRKKLISALLYLILLFPSERI